MLEIQGLRRYFGDTKALDGLDLAAEAGEILGVAGPNGAGKSTLIRILAGEDQPTSGRILLNGEPWDAGRGGDRVAVVHQEPQVFPNLTVAENLLAGREGRRAKRPRAGATELRILADLEIAHVAGTPLGGLPLAIQQRTEIARALARDAVLFLFDEPNSALTEEESNQLFHRLRALAGQGRTVVLVSHRLAELVALAKRVAVIRDGRCTHLLEGRELTQEALAAALVVEEELTGGARSNGGASAAAGTALLRVDRWEHPSGSFAVPSFAIGEGEIVAVMGVEGSGARQFVSSLAARSPALGEVQFGGRVGSPRLLAGVSAYIPASRQQSLFYNFTVAQNLVARLGVGDIATRARWLRRRSVDTVAREASAAFRVRCRSVDQPIGSLSGGNQQKVALAAALRRKPRLLVAEEPTRGVDVGSTAEIYHLLRQFADQGNAVLMYCTEMPEVFEAADQVFVMNQGRLSPPIAVHSCHTVTQLAAKITQLEERPDAHSAYV